MRSECGLCGRPLLRRHWWNNWLLGPICQGRDKSECERLFLAMVIRRHIGEGQDESA